MERGSFSSRFEVGLCSMTASSLKEWYLLRLQPEAPRSLDLFLAGLHLREVLWFSASPLQDPLTPSQTASGEFDLKNPIPIESMMKFLVTTSVDVIMHRESAKADHDP
ncbi:hypothetical protein Y1Q_0002661 [Alligator mississippiensis]|uniref:Uncharacterized protein n=1 Tax=Alligator mississippiensis TaxID=8496 RepID=A0A151NYR2_ALLMI|nr:hypothetical protein Y1Q_0002661 [Alligator mississippiensis]